MSCRVILASVFGVFLTSQVLAKGVVDLLEIESAEKRSGLRAAATLSFTNQAAGQKIDKAFIRVYSQANCSSALDTVPIVLGPVAGGVPLGATGAKTVQIRGDSLYSILDTNNQLAGAGVRFQFARDGLSLRMQTCSCFELDCDSSPCTLSPTSASAGNFGSYGSSNCDAQFITSCDEIEDESICQSSPLDCLWFGICIPNGK